MLAAEVDPKRVSFETHFTTSFLESPYQSETIGLDTQDCKNNRFSDCFVIAIE